MYIETSSFTSDDDFKVFMALLVGPVYRTGAPHCGVRDAPVKSTNYLPQLPMHSTVAVQILPLLPSAQLTA